MDLTAVERVVAELDHWIATLTGMADDVLDLDPEIDRLAKVHAEAGLPEHDRYFIRLPLRQMRPKATGPYEETPVRTTVSWTGRDGWRNEETVAVHLFEVTEFVHHRAGS